MFQQSLTLCRMHVRSRASNIPSSPEYPRIKAMGAMASISVGSQSKTHPIRASHVTPPQPRGCVRLSGSVAQRKKATNDGTRTGSSVNHPFHKSSIVQERVPTPEIWYTLRLPQHPPLPTFQSNRYHACPGRKSTGETILGPRRPPSALVHPICWSSGLPLTVCRPQPRACLLLPLFLPIPSPRHWGLCSFKP